MVRLCPIIAAISAAAVSCLVQPTLVQANESGMASIHSWRKVGKKTCLVDHQHSGSGQGINRKVAELAAINSWASFTDLEYGSSWANFGNAIEKSMTCSAGIGGVNCELLATPCRGR